MSAYVLEPVAFAALAERATQYSHRSAVIGAYRHFGQRFDAAPAIARELARQNIASVAARYPNDPDGQRPGAISTDLEIEDEAARIAEAMCERPPELSPIQLLKLIDCYEYQSCENQDWENTDAIIQVRAIRRAIIRELPGYDHATWGAPDGLAERYEPARHAAGMRTGADGPISLTALMRRR